MADQTLSIEISAADLTSQAFANINRNLNEMKEAAKQTAEGVTGLGGSVSSLVGMGDGLKGILGALGIGLSLEAIKSFNDQVTRQVAALKEQADAVGLSTTELQAYQAAARLSGAGVDTMQKVLGTFNAAIGQANKGAKEQAQAFIDLGVRIRDASGELRAPSDILTETAQKLLAIESPATRAAASVALFGKEGKQLTPLLREIAQGMDELTAKAQKAGLLLSGETIETLHKLQDQADNSRARIAVLWAQLAAPIEDKGLGFVAGRLKEIVDAIALFETHTSGLERFREIMNLISLGTGAAATGETAESRALAGIAAAEARVVEERKKLASLNVGALTGKMSPTGAEIRVTQADIDAQKRALDAEEQNLVRAQNIYRRWKSPPKVENPIDDEIAGWSKYGQGGNQYAPVKDGSRDRIAENLSEVTKQAQAAQVALDRLMNLPTNLPLKDLERMIDLQQKISDEEAKLGKFDPNDPRIKQLEKEITVRETLNTAIQKRKEALATADQIEKTSGDGTAYLRDEMDRLNQALDTGRLSYDAYAVAVRNAQDKAEEMRLTLAGQTEGFRGLVAGMEYAAQQWAKQNRSFQEGQKVGTAFFSALDQGLDVLLGKSNQTFGDIAVSFAQMLAKMAAQAAASDIWQALGGMGGISQGIQNLLGIGNWGGVTSPEIGGADGFAGLNVPLEFADGGRPPVGVPSLIGERGPELWIPDQAGTIVPNHQLGGGNTSVMIPMTVMVGSVVSQAQHERDLNAVEQRARKGAMDGILDARRRGGSTRSIFRN